MLIKVKGMRGKSLRIKEIDLFCDRIFIYGVIKIKLLALNLIPLLLPRHPSRKMLLVRGVGSETLTGSLGNQSYLRGGRVALKTAIVVKFIINFAVLLNKIALASSLVLTLVFPFQHFGH